MWMGINGIIKNDFFSKPVFRSFARLFAYISWLDVRTNVKQEQEWRKSFMLRAYVHNSKLKNATIRMVFHYWVTNDFKPTKIEFLYLVTNTTLLAWLVKVSLICELPLLSYSPPKSRDTLTNNLRKTLCHVNKTFASLFFWLFCLAVFIPKILQQETGETIIMWEMCSNLGCSSEKVTPRSPP